MTDAAADDTVLQIERLIPAPPARVFEYWTEPDLFGSWMGPQGYRVSEHALDVRPGGQWRTTLLTPEGKLRTISGRYVAIEPPRRLVFTWAWNDDAGVRGEDSEVTVTFDPTPGGTKLRIVHRLLPDQASRDGHAWGWNSALEKLAGLAH